MSTLIGQEVRFHADVDGLVSDPAGAVVGMIVDVIGEVITVQLPDGSHVGLPITAIMGLPVLRDVVEEAGGGAGGSAADG